MVSRLLKEHVPRAVQKCLELERARANTLGIQIIDEARYLLTDVWPLCYRYTKHRFVTSIDLCMRNHH